MWLRNVRADEHPLVPGFERFHAEADTQDSVVRGGQFLIRELNCAGCHPSWGGSRRLAPVLSNIGQRAKPEAVRRYLAAPHRAKPGALMPDVFNGLDQDTRAREVEALTHFLVGEAVLRDTPPNPGSVSRGEKLFHTVGCVACHQSQRDSKPVATAVPLGLVDRKYTIATLAELLRNPHVARPSGRMPNLSLTEKEAVDIANYILRKLEVPANLVVEYYEGNWDKLPDFQKMPPKSKGGATGFDVATAARKDHFALVFNGFLHLPKDGEYEFETASDDGSRLLIDGQLIVDNDGEHAVKRVQARRWFKAGTYRLRVEFFERAGGEELRVRMRVPGGELQDLSAFVTATHAPRTDPTGFRFDADLAAKGRQIFIRRNCAACHEMRRDGKLLESPTTARALSPKTASAGCLAETPPPAAPDFHLSAAQRRAISAALTAKSVPKPSPEATIADTMLTFNCYACHTRGGIGGVERARDAWFLTRIREMGDEGRIPPPLDGVGDKLNSEWLKHIMDSGANDRPYMLTRMPKFGSRHVGPIVEAFASSDRKSEVSTIVFKEPAHRVKSAGKTLVGGQGLSCIKCHYFGKHKATGIQAMDLQTMTRRLRRDWFHRYLIDPQIYRPGTRMPAGWFQGRSAKPDVLDGQAPTQIEAVWQYLADAEKASIPEGLIVGENILKPIGTEPVIYRNFLTGLSPRGIAVGYPERANIAWDAGDMSLATIWHGAFIDAAKHWNGRGQGTQQPRGDHVFSLVRGIPIAMLPNEDAPWPASSEARFRGYKLNASGQPTFRYSIGKLQVADFIEPIVDKPYPRLKRTLTIESAEPAENLYFRAAAGTEISVKGRAYLVDDALQMQFNAPGILRAGGNAGGEILIPVRFEGRKATIVQEIRW